MKRQVVLDTETTGLDPASGDRIIEIGALELINHVPTSRHFHTYLDPERLVPAGASEISGITDDMLVGKPKFAAIAEQLLSFIADSELVIHNASFDINFLNHELRRCGFQPLSEGRAFCTLVFARRKFPGAPASLDALCRRFNIDLSERVKHGALLDARLLADVYMELIGGRQSVLLLDAGGETSTADGAAASPAVLAKPRPHALPSRLTDEERSQHRAFVERDFGLKAVWHKFAEFAPAPAVMA